MRGSDYLNREKDYSVKMRKNIMDFIKSYINEHEYPPSYKEIGVNVGLAPSSVNHHINVLFEMGELETDLPDRFSTSRAYRVGKR